MTTATIETTTSASTKPTEKKFQHYRCAKKVSQLITRSGKKFAFINHVLITDDKEIIDYLDTEIEQGLREFTKGELLTAKEADPMRAIKEAAVKEYLIEQAEAARIAALGQSPDMGSYVQSKLNAMGSTGVADGTNKPAAAPTATTGTAGANTKA